MKTSILVLIGQIGAGKSEVARRVASRTRARLLAVDDLRDHGCDTTAEGLVRTIAADPAGTPVIFESTGTFPEFEEVMAGLDRRGRPALVILLECSFETAMHRIRERPKWVAPVVGGSWATHLRWSETQLRLVPADVCIATDAMSPDEAATTVIAAWNAAETTPRDICRTRPTGSFSFSQLASFDICPLAYRYKYVEHRAELIETEQMFLGRQLHAALAYLYRARATVTETDLLAYFAARVAEALPASTPRQQASELLERGSSVLQSHYRNTFRYAALKTIALEKHFAFELSAGVSFAGVIDRIALAASGTYEVIDYKTSARKSTSRPRIPDLLQVAAYGVAAVLEYRVPAVLVSRHLVPSGEDEKLPVRETDISRIRLALLRWIMRIWQASEYPARPGRHCASCSFNPVCPSAAASPAATSLRPEI